MTKLNRLSAFQKFEDVIVKLWKRNFPNFFKFGQIYLARITKVNLDGGKVDINSKGVSFDCEILKNDFTTDTDFKTILDIPFDKSLFGDNGGVFDIPSIGTNVHIGFVRANPSAPFLISMNAEGKTLPEVRPETWRVDTGDGIIWQIGEDKIKVKTAIYNTDIDTIINNTLGHGHLAQGPVNVTTDPSLLPSTPTPLTALSFQTGDL